MNPGIIPTFDSPGAMIPGQFGPISLHGVDLRYSFTITMSDTGIPSVMATISLIPAFAASIIASAPTAGGTKIIETSAEVSATASLTVLKTGRLRCNCPPLPGVTPPTNFVPYSICLLYTSDAADDLTRV